MLSGFAPLSRARQVAVVLGLVYAILGTVGFAVSGFDGFAATRGDRLVVFDVNPLQNLLHLTLGWWLVNAGEAGEVEGRRAAWVAGLLLAALGLLGILLFDSRPDLNIIYANRAVLLGHLLSALLVVVWLSVPRRTSPRR